MSYGYIKFLINGSEGEIPVQCAKITVYGSKGRIVYRTKTDVNGATRAMALPASSRSYRSYRGCGIQKNVTYSADIEAKGFLTKHISGITVNSYGISLLRENMKTPLGGMPDITDEYVDMGLGKMPSDAAVPPEAEIPKSRAQQTAFSTQNPPHALRP